MIKNRNGEPLHISRLFPNVVTIIGLCAGLSAIRFALVEKWELAVGFIVIASLLDAVDGRLARILNSTSEFGAQLDSLSDFFNFGVAPPLILYLWSTHDVKGFGWALVLFFAICCAVRLARFNISLGEEPEAPWEDRFFVGIPAPGGALLAVFPMILTFEFGERFTSLFLVDSYNYLPMAIIVYGLLLAAGMASRIPTYSLKKVKIRPESAAPVLLIIGIMAISAIIEPWITLSIVGVLYLISLPLGIINYYIIRRSPN